MDKNDTVNFGKFNRCVPGSIASTTEKRQQEYLDTLTQLSKFSRDIPDIIEAALQANKLLHMCSDAEIDKEIVLKEILKRV